MPLWYNVCDWPLRSGQLAFWFTVPELKPHLWKMCNVKNGWNESIQKYDTEFTVLKYIVCAVKIFCHVWCCSAHEDIICMATALFYGFDETTTVNLGHKITLYSQPKKIIVEEVVMKKSMFVHLFVILTNQWVSLVWVSLLCLCNQVCFMALTRRLRSTWAIK